jgi:hypothetical protein
VSIDFGAAAVFSNPVTQAQGSRLQIELVPIA